MNQMPETPTSKLAQKKAEWDAKQMAKGPQQNVVITGIDIPFSHLVTLMIKVSIAAVPAALVVGFIWMIIGGFIVGVTSR